MKINFNFFIFLISLFLFSTGCSLLSSRPVALDTEARLQMLPLQNIPVKKAVKVRWSDHFVPAIEAESDSDLAFAFGYIQTYLRWGQLELLKRISQGRLSESVGPLAIDIDHTLRIVNFSKAHESIIDSLEPQTRQWVDRYLEGINFYILSQIKNKKNWPVEFKTLNIKPEIWTHKDLVGVWRLASTDINWFLFYSFLQSPESALKMQLIQELEKLGHSSSESFLSSALNKGSNSFVISGNRSHSRSALLASDPHLGIYIPNLWTLFSLKSPHRHFVGLTIPGLPIIGVGRNSEIAWGGTNMWALSTQIIAIDTEIDLLDHPQAFREETIRVRFWPDKKIKIRESKYGPVISDSPYFSKSGKTLAFSWIGHKVSDEVGSFLKVSEAKTFSAFRKAFHHYAVSGQNMLYADKKGNIGQVLAVRQGLSSQGSNRQSTKPIKNNSSHFAAPTRPSESWTQFKNSDDLPYVYNPSTGFVASANNKPTTTEPPIGLVFAPNDRIDRLTELLSPSKDSAKKWKVDDIKAVMHDLYMKSSHDLAQKIVNELKSDPHVSPLKIFSALLHWDGYYTVDSQGPVAIEIILHQLSQKILESQWPDKNLISIVRRSNVIRDLLFNELDKMKPEQRKLIFESVLKESESHFLKFKNWGKMHTLKLQHPLGNLPLIGSRFQFLEVPYSGGNETLMKAAHSITYKKVTVNYGANARFATDLSSLDENYFVLLGGQDGWLSSPHTLDQLDLWFKNKYMQIPMSDKKLQELFRREILLKP